jgi:hypothetical protein
MNSRCCALKFLVVGFEFCKNFLQISSLWTLAGYKAGLSKTFRLGLPMKANSFVESTNMDLLYISINNLLKCSLLFCADDRENLWLVICCATFSEKILNMALATFGRFSAL